jgi:ribosomal protein S18 acetylase RimI-like enzyme
VETLAKLVGTVPQAILQTHAALPPHAAMGYPAYVTHSASEIGICPPDLVGEALSLALSDFAPEHRASFAAQVGNDLNSPSARNTLIVAKRNSIICGAVWGQLQPGKTAILWPARLAASAPAEIATDLTRAIVRALDAADVEMTQALLLERSTPIASVLEATGFRYLADLSYLSASTSSTNSTDPDDLIYVPYDDSKRNRLINIIERTYKGTLDCAAMNGKRNMDDVLEGYQATGIYRPENWQIVENERRDVGVLLLAEDPAADHFELVYMGLAPEARHKGWGTQIARNAVKIAAHANFPRVALAVDAANTPALNMYRRAGFTAWDHRTVFVRFRSETTN